MSARPVLTGTVHLAFCYKLIEIVRESFKHEESCNMSRKISRFDDAYSIEISTIGRDYKVCLKRGKSHLEMQSNRKAKTEPADLPKVRYLMLYLLYVVISLQHQTGGPRLGGSVARVARRSFPTST